MAEETSLNIGGTWKAIDDCNLNIGGVWKQVDKISVNIGGVWKTVWQNWVVTVDGASRTKLADPVSSSGIGWDWRADGTVYTSDTAVQIDAATDWIIPNAANSEESFVIRFTEEAGTTANWAWNGSTVDGSTWHSLATGKSLEGGSNNGSDATGVATVEISADGGSTILDSATYTINVELLI